MDPIWDYLLNGTLPSDPKEASKLRARSARFILLWGGLYKQGFSTLLLKCIGKEDANYVIREVRKGVCGNHIGARTLAGKTSFALAFGTEVALVEVGLKSHRVEFANA